jgi:hypothetical protein
MMSDGHLVDLRVLIVGIEDLTSRDVIRALVADGAIVMAAACDESALASLQRDLGLYRTTIELAPIDLFSSSEMQLFADNLRAQHKLPHIIVCCLTGSPQLTLLTAPFLQPSLLLDALPQGATRLGRAIASMNSPSLAAWLERGRRRTLLFSGSRPQRVQIAGCVFGFRRWQAHADNAAARRNGRRSRLASAVTLDSSVSHRTATTPCSPGVRRRQN